jgi:hypothetical protein
VKILIHPNSKLEKIFVCTSLSFTMLLWKI